MLLVALPPGPHYGGSPLGLVRIVPARIVVADYVSLASSCRTKLAHYIAPPLQRKPTSLGFALGAAYGGLLSEKFQMVRLHSRAWR